MNNVEIFDHTEFGEIRTIVLDGQPMFCLADVCRALEIKNATDVAKRLDEDELTRFNLGSRSGETNFVTESGLYAVVLRSDKPNAKKFRKWVTSEVLPSIRKTGGYINNVDLVMNAYFDDLPEERQAIIKGLLESIESKQKQITSLDKENDLLAEKALQWADRPLINAIIRTYGRSIGGDYSTAWNEFKKELLYRHGINLNARITHYLNNTGKKTKPRTLDMLDDAELPKSLSTAVALCREMNVDISDIIEKKAC